MNGIVVDASVALAWCFPDEESEYADSVLLALDNEMVLVPAIWAVEVTNALVVGERRKRIGPPEIRRFVELVKGLNVVEHRQTPADTVGNVLPLARAYQLSAYDAAYFDLALRHELPLATLDSSLRKVAAEAGVQIFRPEDKFRR